MKVSQILSFILLKHVMPYLELVASDLSVILCMFNISSIDIWEAIFKGIVK